ncbi:prepilin-type N-terminal cleavage/methylation domain-containing protein [Dokdonia sp.]|uniref:PilW family protein n=1 Tax=Dokdonia sp. TaxID=2024995 RepID=UPI003267CC7D
MKLKAYTLIEVMLTLVISSIVIVFTYTIFLFIDKQMITYQAKTQAYQNFKIVEKTLSRDLYLCDIIEVKEDQMDLIYYDETIISYKKERNQLLRKSNEGSYVSVDMPIVDWSITDTYNETKHGTLIQIKTQLHTDTINLVFTKMKTEMILK